MIGTAEKICPNCGVKLADGLTSCTRCGTMIGSVFAQPQRTIGFFEKNRKKIITGIVVVIFILFFANSVQTSRLKRELECEWYRLEGEQGSQILCILDFSDDEIEYRLETGYSWMNMTAATYEYKVINGKKIKVLRFGDDWETFHIKLNKDKTVMVVSPALTSTDKMEVWYNLN